MEETDSSSVITRFLRHYRDFASHGHLWAAQALQSAITATTDPRKQKLLAVKVFMEFMAAVEDLGALCIAIKHREDPTDLILAYMTYGPRRRGSPSTQLADIFTSLAAGDGLVAVLELPRLDEILAKYPSARDTDLLDLYPQANRALAMVGKAFLANDQAGVRAYNKIKHGFVVVDDASLFSDRPPQIEADVTWIVLDNPSFQLASPSGVSPVELHGVQLHLVGPMIERIVHIRGAVVVLCDLVAELLEHGLITATFHSLPE